MSNPGQTSYGQILKSSALIGGSSVVTVLLGIVRTKFLAVVLGPTGVGLMGMYTGVTGMAISLTGLGINVSGGRQVAEAVGTDDPRRIARAALTLRRAALLLGLLGTGTMALLSRQISRLTFGTTEHAVAIVVLSATVFAVVVSGAQSALIQGMRRIGDLAAMNIIGALVGTVVSVPLVLIWGIPAVPAFLVTVSATAVLTSWWFARRIQVEPVKLSWRETWEEARGLLGLGLVFMTSGLIGSGVFYLLRVIVQRELGLDAVGHFQAAGVLSSVYVGFVLQAMMTDFAPRLTAAAHDHPRCNRLVNEQAEISLLLAVPGILATLAFAPLVIQLFYSAKFGPAVEILRWQVLGVAFQVASWPLGFILIAKGNGKLFLTNQIVVYCVYLLLTLVGVRHFGLVGTGMAFLGMYVFQLAFIFLVVRRVSGFVWSSANKRLAMLFLPPMVAVFLMAGLLPTLWAAVFGGLVALGVGVYSLRRLFLTLGAEAVVGGWRKLKSRLGWAGLKP